VVIRNQWLGMVLFVGLWWGESWETIGVSDQSTYGRTKRLFVMERLHPANHCPLHPCLPCLRIFPSNGDGTPLVGDKLLRSSNGIIYNKRCATSLATYTAIEATPQLTGKPAICMCIYLALHYRLSFKAWIEFQPVMVNRTLNRFFLKRRPSVPLWTPWEIIYNPNRTAPLYALWIPSGYCCARNLGCKLRHHASPNAMPKPQS
jgi:hypothetical protein